MKKILTAAATLCCSLLFAQEFNNLGQNINTEKFTECYPALSPKGDILFFSRDNENGNGYDIMCSKKQKDGTWGASTEIPELNNNNKNVVYDISKNGKRLLLFGTYGDNSSEEGLSFTEFEKGKWTTPEPILFYKRDSIIWGHNAASISKDGKTMIICMDEDLCVSKRMDYKKGASVWTFPQRLPKNINTSKYEYTPHLAPDNKTLYFSTNGHGGFGKNDIVSVTKKGKSWTEWTDPVNLGEPINSPDWESFYLVDKKNEFAIVYSRKEGNGDLYSLKLKEQ